jgi:hypothetical protein
MMKGGGRMYKLTLFVIVVGFLGLFVTHSLSFSNAEINVGSKLAITDSSNGLISANDLNVQLTEKKGQNEVLGITNHLSEPIYLSEDDIYPLADDKFFHIEIEPVTVQPGTSADANIVVYAHKNKTPSGDYDLTLHMTWGNGSSEIPLHLHLENDLHENKNSDQDSEDTDKDTNKDTESETVDN